MSTAAPLHRALGLTDDERDEIERVLGRSPNPLELALYAVMWSEHCSYKSSRLHLRRLPTEGEGVLVGPGENAGVIRAGDGIAVALRIESHNHPSAIEPAQGAATGVGGILRDIFAMGARPLAVMDPLFFGPIDSARQRWLVEGVVRGISSYGNSVGVPTVGGELTFAPGYADNPLVNVLCLGALPEERLVRGIATGEGNLAVLLGSTTGRDGIGGVSVLASAGFGAAGDDDAKRPSVQVGDPFEEKRLIEACLALLDHGLVLGIQDLGGAGLACATSETAARGGVGMDVDVTAVPRREPGMSPVEVMTSESQERMLAIVRPEDWPAAKEICDRWEVRATTVGRVTAPVDGVGWLRVREGFDGPVLAEVPAASLAHDAPLYDRPRTLPADLAARRADEPWVDPERTDLIEDIYALLGDAHWVYRQYDSMLFLNTVVGPGRDATLLRLSGPGLPPSQRAIGLTTDSNPSWCALDPRLGTAWTLVEAVANLACVGATPAAVVNCLNFGNPEHPEVMWQLSEAVDGLSEACRALDLPVIGGNVSLYNESQGRDIDPTPVLGVVGLVEALEVPPAPWSLQGGDVVVLLGERRAPGPVPFPLGGSRWATRRGMDGGALPPIELEAARRTCAFVAQEIAKGMAGHPSPLRVAHDIAGGGLALALAEFATASDAGLRLIVDVSDEEFRTEVPGRFLAVTADPTALLALAASAEVAAEVLGLVEGNDLVLREGCELSPAALAVQHSRALQIALGAV